MAQVPKEHQEEPGKVFIKKVPPTTRDQELASFLETFGPLVYCYLIKSGNKRSRKFGFARFEDPLHAKHFVKAGTVQFNGSPILVSLFKDRVASKEGQPQPASPTQTLTKQPNKSELHPQGPTQARISGENSLAKAQHA